VRKKIFVPIRYRRDGSVYFHKTHPISSAVGETLAIALFIVTALLLLALAMVQASAAVDQEPKRPAAESATANGSTVLNQNTAHAGEENVTDEAVLLETTTLPSLWPVRGGMTHGFGSRRNPFRRRSSEFHPGQDIAAPKGTHL